MREFFFGYCPTPPQISNGPPLTMDRYSICLVGSCHIYSAAPSGKGAGLESQVRLSKIIRRFVSKV